MTNELKIGKLIKGEERRDAIHIAIAPVSAGCDLRPGAHVGLIGEGVVSTQSIRFIGIIDPFLTKMVLKGERCWLFIYPNQVTSLRHEWTHPGFDKDAPTEPIAFVPAGVISEENK